MAKKLTADEIKWILSIDATEAQQAFRTLEKDSRQLTTTNKALRDKMNDLIATGKKGSEEYKRLDAEIKKNNTTLSQNKEKMSALQKTMGITNLTMSQLRKMAKDLQRQLDSTSMATDPVSYKKLSSELNTVRDRMNELNIAGKKTEEVLQSTDSFIKKGSVAVFLGNIWTKMLGVASKAIEKTKEFIVEGNKMAGVAQGVKRAFDRISTPGLLSNLQTETKNMVNNLNLMKTAVQAKNFKIPLTELGVLFRFAQQRAQETDESVQYLTDSIVKGIGRESPLILDNLGISTTRLNQELAKTGDFAKAVGNIVREELANSGTAIDTSADKAQQRAVLLENIQLSIGMRMRSSLDMLKDSWGNFLTVVDRWVKIPVVETLRSEQRELNVLARSVIYTSEQEDVRKLLIEELNRQYPDFLKNLDTEKLTNEQLVKHLKDVNKQYDARIRAQVEQDTILTPLEEKKRKLHEQEMKDIMLLTTVVEQYGDRLSDTLKEAIKSGDVTKLTVKDVTDGINYSLSGVGNKELANIEGVVKRMKSLPGELEKINAEMEKSQKAISSFGVQEKKETPQAEPKSLIKEKEKELLLAKAMSEATEEEIIAKNKKVDVIEKEIDRLKKLGVVTKEKTKIQKTAMETELQDLDNQHAQEQTLLKKQKMETLQTEEQYNAKIYAQEVKHQDKRIELLNQYKEKTSDKATLVNLEKQLADAETKKLEAQQKSQDLGLTLLKKGRDEALQEQDYSSKSAQIALEKSLATQQITKEQYDALQLVLDSTMANNRLAILQQYQTDVESLEFASGTLRAEAVKEANIQVLNADLVAAKARSAQQMKLKDLVKDFKTEFKLTTVDEDKKIQLETLEASYQARKKMAEEEGLDTTEITAAYNRAKTNIEKETKNEILKIREQYGLVSLQEQYNAELDLLKQQHEKGLLSEEDYEKAKKQLKIKYQKENFDYYKNLVSGAVSALQDAELDNIDAKYDAEIERAQGNADEVARLETEKEQKKLDVQKKYANVNFAIKASEIIANTAVAIMKALSELGPIAGPIAAALMGITGAAQLAVANAERKKIMNMTVSGSSSGSSNTGKRVVTGKESGGFVSVSRAQDGKPFNAEYDPDKRGYVDHPTVIVGEGPAGKSREWVASNDALDNPTVAPIIQLLNESQEKGEIRTVDMNQIMRKRLAGFESGGAISTPVSDTSSGPVNATPTGSVFSAEDRRTIEKFIQQLKNGVMAYVLRSELNKEAELAEKSKKIGGK